MLVSNARNGSIDDFGQLYQRYYKSIVAIAYSMTGSTHTAEEIAQETFAVACGDIIRLRDLGKFAQWLAGICRNLSRKALRDKKEKRLSNDMFALIADQPEDEADQDLIENVRQAVLSLSDKSREVIILRYYEGLNYEQIAEINGLTNQAINGWIFRAKKKIASYLKKKGLYNE
ncbi:MAG: sigma-70 family RNA polymerase sigma factor [Anaerohalosphaera sp.]|nr:sigma-70 family RNA polymerase sigma factor [Anaerohalosphaera sp.]